MPITIPPPALRAAAVRFGVDPGGLDALERGGAPDGAVFPCRRDGRDAFLKIKPVAVAALPAEQDKIDVQDHLRGRVGVLTYLPSVDGHLLEVVADDDGGEHLPTWRDEHAMFLAGCQDDAVHNDLHSGNLLLGPDGRVTVLDFDVCARHLYATDLAILLVHPIWDLRRQDPSAIQPFVDTALAAYAAQYPLPAEHLAHTPLLMRYRMALFVLAMAVELGDTPRPPWPAEIRAWVLSGEPVAGIRFG